MENRSSSQTKARMLIAAVFVIGFAAGALSLNLYERLTAGKPKPNEQRNHVEVILQRMDEKMRFNDQQRDQVRQILSNTSDKYGEIRKKMDPLLKEYAPQFDSVRQQARNEIRAVLTDKQLPEFEKIVQEQDRERQEREKERTPQEDKDRRNK